MEELFSQIYDDVFDREDFFSELEEEMEKLSDFQVHQSMVNLFKIKYQRKLFQNDRNFFLKILRKDGKSLKFATKELQNDKEIVTAAVMKHGRSLKYASKELQNDKEIVLKAINNEPFAFTYASSELWNNVNFLVEVVKTNIDALEFGSRKMKDNKEFILEAVKFNPHVVNYASNTLKNDKIFMSSVKGVVYEKSLLKSVKPGRKTPIVNKKNFHKKESDDNELIIFQRKEKEKRDWDLTEDEETETSDERIDVLFQRKDKKTVEKKGRKTIFQEKTAEKEKEIEDPEKYFQPVFIPGKDELEENDINQELEIIAESKEKKKIENEVDALKDKIKELLAENEELKNQEKEVKIYFENQVNLRFTSLKDYKILELINGKIDHKEKINGFIYKVMLGKRIYVMKILRIFKEQNPKSLQLYSENTAEILLVVKPENISFTPHKNVISIYHAFKEDLNENKLKLLKNVKGDEKDDVFKLFNSSLFNLNKNTGILIMEHFESNLGELKKKKNYNFSEDEFLSILEQLLEGLNHIHNQNIVHRNIKLENIFTNRLFFVVIKLLEKNSDVNFKRINPENLFNLINYSYGDQFREIEIIDGKTFKVECKSEKSKINMLKYGVLPIIGKKCSISDPKTGSEQIRCIIGNFGCSYVCDDSFIVPKIDENHKKHEIFGNTYHFPQEVLDSINSISSTEINYSKSDVFAVGLTCYSLICKNDPFGGISESKRKKKDYIDIKKNYSYETKELLKKICCVDYNERYSITTALRCVREIRKTIK